MQTFYRQQWIPNNKKYWKDFESPNILNHPKWLAKSTNFLPTTSAISRSPRATLAVAAPISSPPTNQVASWDRSRSCVLTWKKLEPNSGRLRTPISLWLFNYGHVNSIRPRLNRRRRRFFRTPNPGRIGTIDGPPRSRLKSRRRKLRSFPGKFQFGEGKNWLCIMQVCIWERRAVSFETE